MKENSRSSAERDEQLLDELRQRVLDNINARELKETESKSRLRKLLSAPSMVLPGWLVNLLNK